MREVSAFVETKGTKTVSKRYGGSSRVAGKKKLVSSMARNITKHKLNLYHSTGGKAAIMRKQKQGKSAVGEPRTTSRWESSCALWR